MHPARIPEQLRAKCYCPSCGYPLVPVKCSDPWAICLVCQGNHRFFILPQTPLAVDTAGAASASFPEITGLSLEAIASFWLSDPRARALLNEQLAELLRVGLEARSVLAGPRFSFCPTCGETLEKDDQPLEYYLRGLRCQKGHAWTLRGNCFFSTDGSMSLELHAEHSDAVVSQLIASWLKGDPYLESNLHESIRRVLISLPL
jgi:hypothetical protein